IISRLKRSMIKQTINKQVLTVFFLHVIFSFIHLAFAYHILNLIFKVIEVVDTAMMLTVTLSICGVFALIYVLIFIITSRSYRKIVQI
ncbi:TPA: ABC transporter, partial [Streptococcus suis]